MNTKSIFAVLGGFVTLMLAGLFFYEVILKSYFTKLMESLGDCFLKEPPVLPIIVAHLCFSVILYMVLSSKNVSTFIGGIKGSWLLVILVMVWYDAWAFTFMPQMTITMAVIDVAVNSTCTILAAGVIGWVLGKYK